LIIVVLPADVLPGSGHLSGFVPMLPTHCRAEPFTGIKRLYFVGGEQRLVSIKKWGK
jgi:hypothetical protein